MNRSHLRRKVEKIESDSNSHVSSADLPELTVVEMLSYDCRVVDDDVIKIVDTGEFRDCRDFQTFFED